MSNGSNNLVEFQGFILDTEKKLLQYKEEHVELPLKAIELLCLLVQSDGELLTKEQILNSVWKDSFVEESVLTQNIYRLRKLFKSYGIEHELIKNVPRRGYRFQGEITDVIEEEVSIERTVVEKQLVVEYDDAEPINEFVGIETKQIPAHVTQSFFQKNRAAFAGLIVLLSFFAIGAGVWFWKSSNEKSKTNFIKGNLRIEPLTTAGKAFMPAISRDNQHLAYIRNDRNTYSIVLEHITTGSETVVVDPVDYEIRSLNFSADGNYIYYITREKKYLESTIYQVPIYGGSKRKIMSGIRHYFSLSPDGEKFAFFKYDPEKDVTHLMTSNTDGSDQRIVFTGESASYFHVWQSMPAWSPDGKKFVVSAYNRDKEKSEGSKGLFLLEIDIETGQEKQVKHPAWKHASQAYWLKDGNGLIVSVHEDLTSYSQIWHLSYPDGKATRITNDTNHYPEFTLSYDTNSIITESRSENSNLFLVKLEDPENVQKITSQAIGHYGMWGIDWTKDGESLVYVKSEGRNDGNLWMMNIETKETRQLTFDKNYRDEQPKITPDGKSVLFTSNRSGKSHIWQIDLDGNNLVQVTDTADGEEYPEISGDGKWLFYKRFGADGTELWKRPMLGGEEVKILHHGGVSKVSPTDSNQIITQYFDSKEKEKTPWKYVLFSHEAKTELRHLDFIPHNHSFEWKKDGSGFYFAKRATSQNDLMFYSLKDDKIQKITNFSDQKITNLDVSPDGKTIAISRGNLVGNILRIEGFAASKDN